MAQNWNISLSSAGANPNPLTANGGDKITWSNDGTDTLTLTLPDCVTPNPGPITILKKTSSGEYTINEGKTGTSAYSWATADGPSGHGRVKVVKPTTWAPIYLTPGGAIPETLHPDPGDKVSWVNGYESATIVLTMPACVAPKETSVTLAAGDRSQTYTVNVQKQRHDYYWRTGSAGNDSGTIDVS